MGKDPDSKKKRKQSASDATANADAPETETSPAAENGSASVEEAAEKDCRVRGAADAVHCAEEELRKARVAYEKVKADATERLKAVREKSVGQVIDGVLGFVRKHPGPGLLMAVLAGWFLGRLFRRR